MSSRFPSVPVAHRNKLAELLGHLEDPRIKPEHLRLFSEIVRKLNDARLDSTSEDFSVLQFQVFVTINSAARIREAALHNRPKEEIEEEVKSFVTNVEILHG